MRGHAAACRRSACRRGAGGARRGQGRTTCGGASGRALTLAYVPPDGVLALQAEAYARFLGENALNTDAFPSLRMLQADVVDIVSGWLHGGAEAAGFLTSGGTESILLAVRAARERARVERGVTEPEMVLAESAHAAFEKAADYFGVRSVRVPVDAGWRADVDAMADARSTTARCWSSRRRRSTRKASSTRSPRSPRSPPSAASPATSTPASAASRSTTSSGSATPVAPWDFRVDGVTSISVDLHKYGYTAKGASVLLHRTKALRRYQTFLTERWLGGRYGSSGVLGTKSGGTIAVAWAVLQHLGDAGYLRLTAAARRATEALADAASPPSTGWSCWPRPTPRWWPSGPTDPTRLDVFAVADALWRRGWYLDRQGPPPSLHCTAQRRARRPVPELLVDLGASVDEAQASHEAGEAGAYGTVD